ncbi:MAG: F0F1 ATP synthase subunit alpha [Patescibacteria group bacterium]
MIKNEEIIKELEKNLIGFSQNSKTKNVGYVEKNSDGVISASGLSQAFIGEQVVFKNDTKGMILGLDEDTASIILFDSGNSIVEGDKVETTGKILAITSSEALIGRVVSPLGAPLDGKSPVKTGKNMLLERIAAGVIDREPVGTPLKTGIKLIDAIIPIGRGQRELIIGDRGLGKTAVAIDTIINQKNKDKRYKPVICIYVAIGQKQSTVAQVIAKLKETGAMDYSIIVSATSADPAALQYLAPYAGVAIAEYFLEKGEDVLIVYDDLSKHAWAYRQISLILRRPAGREAYPGDIFYLHSRLLERSVKLSKKNGGGSITALPIVETQANDISAYIPTNIISITDGQIYLQSDLFNAGIRPAINIGNSVSRVGGAAQTSAIKSVAGKMRLDLAQYRELAAFAQFGSELDQATLSQLERGKRITEILKQAQYNPLPEPLQILSMWTVTTGKLDNIPVDKIQKFESEFHNFVVRKHPDIIKTLELGEKLKEETAKKMEKALESFRKMFN